VHIRVCNYLFSFPLLINYEPSTAQDGEVIMGTSEVKCRVPGWGSFQRDFEFFWFWLGVIRRRKGEFALKDTDTLRLFRL